VLVIALASTGAGDEFSWSGRRHDDDVQEGPRGSSADDLFDAVFHALHDGEQTAVGVDCALTASVPGDGTDESALLAAAAAAEPVASREQLRHLLDQLGMWRPWTAVTSSPQRWLATQSILAWEWPAGKPADDVITRFFANVRRDRPAEAAPDSVVNLAVAAALRAGLTVDRAELTQPALTISGASSRQRWFKSVPDFHHR
jgi:hypothetical protein